MPSPFGSRRGPSTYYEYGGSPHHYDYNWKGMPAPGYRAAETRALGDWPVAMTMESGRKSLLHSGPEQNALGAAQISRNEKYLLIAGAVGLAGYLAWKKWGKRK